MVFHLAVSYSVQQFDRMIGEGLEITQGLALLRAEEKAGSESA